MSNLSKYAALHRLTNELNVEAESASETPLTEERQVVAAVGGAVMALGMGLAELATEENLTEEQASYLLTVADGLSLPAANGFKALAEVAGKLEGTSPAMTKDLAGDIESIDVFVMGLEQVGDFAKARPKPTPLAEPQPE